MVEIDASISFWTPTFCFAIGLPFSSYSENFFRLKEYLDNLARQGLEIFNIITHIPHLRYEMALIEIKVKTAKWDTKDHFEDFFYKVGSRMGFPAVIHAVEIFHPQQEQWSHSLYVQRNDSKETKGMKIGNEYRDDDDDDD